MRFSIVVVGLVLAGAAAFAQAGDFINEGELKSAQRWTAEHLGGDVSKVPFSFKLGDESSATVLGRSKSDSKSEKLDDNRTRRTLTWTDGKTGLETKVVAVEYADYPTVEWTVYFKNVGNQETPILSEIEGLDATLAVNPEATTVLHHHKGSRAAPNDFEPYEMGLPMRTRASFSSAGGRGTNGNWPYFNVNWGGGGWIVALGWPGQWQADFYRDGGSSLTIRGGQEGAHFKLNPDESARTPLNVLQWYSGDWIRGMNVWRRWMVAHNLPRQNGEPAKTQLVACSSHQFGEMIHANEENQKLFIDRYVEEKFPLAYWWMDAGWYVNDGNWVTTGTWEVDKNRFPHGLRAVTDHAHEKGLKAIVWFEPERVAPSTWLYNERPEWLLAPPKNPGDQLYDERWRLLNLGNKEAREWLIKHVNGIIDSEGIDLYRQDFNMDPLYCWRNGEAEDRQGINENHYVEGYLAYWDAILSAHPGMRIDTCASGGRRLDLETLRRSVPLVRSDCLFEPTSQQSHTYGISMWLPYHGTGTLVGKSAIGQNTTEGVNEYDFRSHMASSVTACWDMRDKSLDYDKLRRLVDEMTTVSPLFLKDYYPLTRHNLSPTEWIAWEYVSPEEGKGMVLAFRRQESDEAEKSFKLHGLDGGSTYKVEALGTDDSWTATGADLMGKGLEAKLPERRTSGLYLLTKLKDPSGA